jgi:hypothetical protein
VVNPDNEDQPHHHFATIRGLPQNKDHRHLSWARDHYTFDRKKGYPSTLGPTSSQSGTGLGGEPLHKHHHGPFCHHRKSKALELGVKNMEPNKEKQGKETENKEEPAAKVDERSGLRLRLWLESRRKEEEGRQFASYEIVVPDLKVQAKNGTK